MSFGTQRTRVSSVSPYAIGRFVALTSVMLIVTAFAWLELGPRWGVQLGVWIGVLELVALKAGL